MTGPVLGGLTRYAQTLHFYLTGGARFPVSLSRQIELEQISYLYFNEFTRSERLTFIHKKHFLDATQRRPVSSWFEDPLVKVKGAVGYLVVE